MEFVTCLQVWGRPNHPSFTHIYQTDYTNLLHLCPDDTQYILNTQNSLIIRIGKHVLTQNQSILVSQMNPRITTTYYNPQFILNQCHIA